MNQPRCGHTEATYQQRRIKVKYLNDDGDVYCVKNKLTTKGSAPTGKLDVEKEHCKAI
jgi:hypothetical protein